MTCFLVFMQAEGPAQLATGAMITFVFLVLNLKIRPFCSDNLNAVQTFSLVAQFLTLFSGILIGYLEEMEAGKNAKSSDQGDQNDTGVLGSMIVVINCATLVWPILRKIMVGKVEEYMEKLLWCAGLPRSCYMNYCCGNKRAEAKRIKMRDERASKREEIKAKWLLEHPEEAERVAAAEKHHVADETYYELYQADKNHDGFGVCARVFLAVYIHERMRKCHVSALTVCLFDMERGAAVDFKEFCLLPENQGMSHTELRLEFDKYDKNDNENLGRSELRRFHDDRHAPNITSTRACSMPDEVQPTVEVSQQAREAPMLAQSCAPVAPAAIEASQTHPLVSIPAWDNPQPADLSAPREAASLQWMPQQLTGTLVANSDIVMQSGISMTSQPRRQFVRHEPKQPAENIATSELTFSGFEASSDREQVKPVMCLAHLEARQDSESEDLGLPTPVESPRNVLSIAEPPISASAPHGEPDDRSAPASRWTSFFI